MLGSHKNDHFISRHSLRGSNGKMETFKVKFPFKTLTLCLDGIFKERDKQINTVKWNHKTLF